MKRITYIHGWGFDPRVWERLASLLPEYEADFIDFGYTGNAGNMEAQENPLVVAHSFGVLWALENIADMKALISISGFDCFYRHVPAGGIRAMQRGLGRDPAALLTGFRQACGVSGFDSTQRLDVRRLEEDLRMLGGSDATERLRGLGCPVLALAARDDAIVPAAMSEAIWAGRGLRWSEDGGHCLQHAKPSWCASLIEEFLR